MRGLGDRVRRLMSAPAQLSPQLETSAASSLELTFYISVVSLVLWIWDVLLNLDAEISVIWSRKGTMAKTFYAVVSHSRLEGF